MSSLVWKGLSLCSGFAV
uniref:Uncharacterized protein n=1 Tax=Rhizophora mucronata TaxID=61149 RepID=A0A2P2QH74_RHIMU